MKVICIFTLLLVCAARPQKKAGGETISRGSSNKEEAFFKSAELSLGREPNPMIFNMPRNFLKIRQTYFYFDAYLYHDVINVNNIKLTKVEGEAATDIDPKEGDIKYSIRHSHNSPITYYARQSALVRFYIPEVSCATAGVYRLSHGEESVDFRITVDECDDEVTEVLDVPFNTIAFKQSRILVGLHVYSLDIDNVLNAEDLVLHKQDADSGEWTEYTADMFRGINVDYRVYAEQDGDRYPRVYGGIFSRHAVCELHGDWKMVYGTQEATFKIHIQGCRF